jgi:hypothetical protein
MNEAALRDLIHTQLADGRLPSEHVIRFHAGYGDETSCSVCAQIMHASDIVYELTFGEGRDAHSLVMHYRCFSIWERERGAFVTH